MIREFAMYAGLVSVCILALNTIGLGLYHKRLPTQIKKLLPYLGVGLVTELVSRWMFAEKINNLFLLHIYTLLEFITLSYFYYMLFQARNKLGKFIYYFTILGSLLIIANSLFLEPLSGFNANAKTLVQLTIISYAVAYFFDAFGRIDLTDPVARSISLVNLAVILYYSGSFFIFMCPKMLTKIGVSFSHINVLWGVNALLSIVFQTILLISLWTAASTRGKY